MNLYKTYCDTRAVLSSRPDTEHGQAFVRMVVVSFLTLYAYFAFFSHWTGSFGQYQLLFYILFSFTFCLSIIGLIIKYPAPSDARRIVGMIHDNVGAGMILISIGENGVIGFVVYLWITLGNGFRFGRKYLYICGSMSLVSFVAVVATTDYWQQNKVLTFTFLIALVVLPLYVSNLLKILETERSILKKTVKDLFYEKERAQVTLHSIGDGVITTDGSGNVDMLNSVSERLTGWTRQEAHGKPLPEVFKIFVNGSSFPAGNPAKEVFLTRRIVELSNHTILEARDGARRHVEDSCAPIYGSDGELIGTVLVFRDVTEKEKLEEEAMRARKLDSIGVLAGGIAHDFNNFLTAIIGNISMAKLFSDRNGKAYLRLNDADQAAGLAKSLAGKLLTFAKGGAPVRVTTAIINIFKDAADLSLRGSNVICRFQVPEDLWMANVDPTQISQVAHNLVINAVQAMPAGGMIRVEAENISVAEDEIAYVRPGNYIRVSVKDTGHGIPEKYIDKIFDPYFTTKEKGSGLGLATSYNIMKSHYGNIFVASGVGDGATFTLYLPASNDAKPRKTATRDLPNIEFGKRSGRVLVMDDEPLIRDLAVVMLEHLGYAVSTASDGAIGLDLYRQAKAEGKRFDLVISDLTVPGGMGGEAFIKALKKEFPEAKAVVSSGYSNDSVMSDFKAFGFIGMIQKPYKVADIQRLLDEVRLTS